MLICKNCNTENDDQVIFCTKCKMQGMFTKDNTVSIKSNQGLGHMTECKNCRHNLTEIDTNCPRCMFPVVKGKVDISLGKTNLNI